MATPTLMASFRGVAILAWRNLWRNYRRSLIMLLAIAIGVWAMVFMAALMRGMTDQMVRNGLQILPGEVQVHHRDYRRDPSVVNSMGPPAPALLAAMTNSTEAMPLAIAPHI